MSSKKYHNLHPMINPHFSSQLEDIIKDYPEHLHTDPPNLSSSLITDLQQVISKEGALLALEGINSDNRCLLIPR